LNRVPRSLIAEIAMDLLGSCETWEYPPGHFLNGLVRELLNLDHDRQGMSRDVERQELAAAIIAQAPKVGTRELAKALHVNASTISRWRRSPEFKKLVEQKVDSFKHLAQAREMVKEFTQKGLLQKEAIALLLATAAQLHKSRNNPD
jgi:DNA-binding MurR/RpiR family transcriptional regulator